MDSVFNMFPPPLLLKTANVHKYLLRNEIFDLGNHMFSVIFRSANEQYRVIAANGPHDLVPLHIIERRQRNWLFQASIS